MISDRDIQQHYGLFGRRDAILEALAASGKDIDRLAPSDLTPFDQLHTTGHAATTALTALLAPAAGEHVLDVGCGIGGPARLLARDTGCRVTGIDLTAHFTATARDLTRRTQQDAAVSFVNGSATALPFADATFDRAWHIHMSMNVPDKRAMYAEICRVLRPGGRFAFYDPIRGEQNDVSYPVPWAATPDTSFLVRRAEMLGAIAAAGLRVIDVSDATAESLAWFAALSTGGSAATSQQLRQDPRFVEMSRNHRANLQAGAVVILRGLFERPS